MQRFCSGWVYERESSCHKDFLRLEGHLEGTPLEVKAMKVVDGILGLLVVGHGHEAIAFANPLAGFHDDIHLLDSAKWGEELPQGAFSGVVADVVAENCISRLQNINETFGLF